MIYTFFLTINGPVGFKPTGHSFKTKALFSPGKSFYLGEKDKKRLFRACFRLVYHKYEKNE